MNGTKGKKKKKNLGFYSGRWGKGKKENIGNKKEVEEKERNIPPKTTLRRPFRGGKKKAQSETKDGIEGVLWSITSLIYKKREGRRSIQ